MRKLKLFTVAAFVLGTVLFGYRIAFAAELQKQTLRCTMVYHQSSRDADLTIRPSEERSTVLIKPVGSAVPFGQLHLFTKSLRPVFEGRLLQMKPVELEDLVTRARISFLRVSPNDRIDLKVEFSGDVVIFQGCVYRPTAASN